MNTIYLALGSNIGNPSLQIEKAIELLGSHIQNVRQAPIYRTRPVGYRDQGNFLNTAISARTALGPQELLVTITKIEADLGRKKRFRWGPREIDIDIIFFNDQIIKTATLTLPHPSFRKRDFVLRPLADLNEELIDPITKKTVRQLLDKLRPEELSIINKL